jgi:hypothetical protein
MKVHEAMAHFGLAQTAYEESYTKGQWLKQNVLINLAFRSASKDSWASCLLALCYADLKEFRLTETSIKHARQARDIALSIARDRSDLLFDTANESSVWRKASGVQTLLMLPPPRFRDIAIARLSHSNPVT